MKMIKKNDGENIRHTRDVYWVRRPVVSDLASGLDFYIKEWKARHCPDLSFPEAMLALSMLTVNKTVNKIVEKNAKVSQAGGA